MNAGVGRHLQRRADASAWKALDRRLARKMGVPVGTVRGLPEPEWGALLFENWKRPAPEHLIQHNTGDWVFALGATLPQMGDPE